jgi:hypothetical protein
MHIELDERSVTDAAKSVNLAGLDDENVTRPCFEFLSVDGPETAAFPHELDFVVRMTMRARATTRQSAEQEHGDVHIAVVGPDEVVRAALKWQVLLTNAVHPAVLLWTSLMTQRRVDDIQDTTGPANGNFGRVFSGKRAGSSVPVGRVPRTRET